MSQVLSSETGMAVQRLLRLVDANEGFIGEVRWEGILWSEDTLEPLQIIYKCVPVLIQKVFQCRGTSAQLCKRATEQLGLGA